MPGLETQLQNSIKEVKRDPFFGENKEPRWWTLYYRYSNIPQITKGFKFDGSLSDAIKRGQEHCRVMGYLFICVRPMLVDLDYQERVFLEAQTKGLDEEAFK